MNNSFLIVIIALLPLAAGMLLIKLILSMR